MDLLLPPVPRNAKPGTVPDPPKLDIKKDPKGLVTVAGATIVEVRGCLRSTGLDLCRFGFLCLNLVWLPMLCSSSLLPCPATHSVASPVPTPPTLPRSLTFHSVFGLFLITCLTTADRTHPTRR